MITKNNYLTLNVYFEIPTDAKTGEQNGQFIALRLYDRGKKELATKAIPLDKLKDPESTVIDQFVLIDTILDFCEENKVEFITMINNQNFYSFLVKKK